MPSLINNVMHGDFSSFNFKQKNSPTAPAAGTIVAASSGGPAITASAAKNQRQSKLYRMTPDRVAPKLAQAAHNFGIDKIGFKLQGLSKEDRKLLQFIQSVEIKRGLLNLPPETVDSIVNSLGPTNNRKQTRDGMDEKLMWQCIMDSAQPMPEGFEASHYIKNAYDFPFVVSKDGDVKISRFEFNSPSYEGTDALLESANDLIATAYSHIGREQYDKHIESGSTEPLFIAVGSQGRDRKPDGSVENNKNYVERVRWANATKAGINERMEELDKSLPNPLTEQKKRDGMAKDLDLDRVKQLVKAETQARVEAEQNGTEYKPGQFWPPKGPLVMPAYNHDFMELAQVDKDGKATLDLMGNGKPCLDVEVRNGAPVVTLFGIRLAETIGSLNAQIVNHFKERFPQIQDAFARTNITDVGIGSDKGAFMRIGNQYNDHLKAQGKRSDAFGLGNNIHFNDIELSHAEDAEHPLANSPEHEKLKKLAGRAAEAKANEKSGNAPDGSAQKIIRELAREAVKTYEPHLQQVADNVAKYMDEHGCDVVVKPSRTAHGVGILNVPQEQRELALAVVKHAFKEVLTKSSFANDGFPWTAMERLPMHIIDIDGIPHETELRGVNTVAYINGKPHSVHFPGIVKKGALQDMPPIELENDDGAPMLDKDKNRVTVPQLPKNNITLSTSRLTAEQKAHPEYLSRFMLPACNLDVLKEFGIKDYAQLKSIVKWGSGMAVFAVGKEIEAEKERLKKAAADGVVG